MVVGVLKGQRDKFYGMYNERKTIEHNIKIVINEKQYTGWAEIMIHSDRVFLGDVFDSDNKIVNVSYGTKSQIENLLPSALKSFISKIETI